MEQEEVLRFEKTVRGADGKCVVLCRHLKLLRADPPRQDEDGGDATEEGSLFVFSGQRPTDEHF